MYQLRRHLFDELSSDSTTLEVIKLQTKKKRIKKQFITKSIKKVKPLFVRKIRSIPFLCSAILANSQKDSLILKSQSGEISKHAILLRVAYKSACLKATCLLNAK